VTYIGRSEECEVTLEDPLVSRRHARIVFEGDEASIEDLGSRNGVRVNGKPLRGTRSLTDGDRVRIGSQDFVLCRVQPRAEVRPFMTTGVLRLCAHCRAPYAREALSCPQCGTEESKDEDTLSGAFASLSQYDWSVQLLVEALEKALGLERLADAERILRRATALLEERLASGEKVLPAQLAPLATAADRICRATGDATWGVWVARFCARAPLFPPAAVTDRLVGLRLRHVDLAESVEELLAYCRSVDVSQKREDREAVARLARAHHGIGEESSRLAPN
jgi:hypothetical protein